MSDATQQPAARGAVRHALAGLGLHPDADLTWLPDDATLGRVVVVHGAAAEVTWFPDDPADAQQAGSPPGEVIPRAERFELRRDLPLRPVAGDWVAVADGELVDVGPRETSLARPDPNGRDTQVLAANIDLALIVVPIDREPNLTALERLSVMVWDSGATPLLVLTKADLSPDPQDALAQVTSTAPGIEAVMTSAYDGTGLPELRARLGPGVTATMLGQSGAGKTSLLNALDGHAEAVRDVRRDGQGRHTTSTRRLYPLAGGGVLLDLPGLRKLDLLATPEAVDATFDDIAALARACRFGDCVHEGDAGCAVEAAVAVGGLSPRRLHTWRRVQRELAHRQRRNDPAAMAQERAKWTRISKAQKRFARMRGRS